MSNSLLIAKIWELFKIIFKYFPILRFPVRKYEIMDLILPQINNRKNTNAQ